MSRSPIFIVGSPRSGTSILVDLMLSAGYRGFREGMFLSLMANVDQLLTRHFGIFAIPGSREVLASVVDQAALRARIFDSFRSIAEQHNPVAPWFDKTGNPEMIEAIPHLRALWPDCAFIFARRRGIENIISRMRKFPNHTFQYHCADWARNMATWRRMRTLLPPESRIEVDQQDMIQRPEEVVDRLVGFLPAEESRRAAMLHTLRANRPQQTEEGSASRVVTLAGTQWNPQQVEAFHRHCDEEMNAYGYSFDASYLRQG